MSEADELIAAGRLAEAAALLEIEGEPARAAGIYEQLWDFGAAARAARAARDLPRALLNTLRGGSPGEVEALTAEVGNAGSADLQRRCAEICEQRGAPAHAAHLYERAGDLARAAALYGAAGLTLEAATLHERAGAPKEAIALYRQHLADDPENPPARFALARLLLHFGEQAEALPHLQRVLASGDALARRAGVAAVAALHRLGYPDAAKAALARLHAITGDAASSVTSCLADADLAPLASSGDEAPLLAGRYRLGPLIGSGGMGRVYRGRDELRDQSVAVKVFTAPGGARGRDAFKRFVREALVTGRLQHAHIVSLVDFNEEMGFLVLELMEGGDLAARLRPRLSPAACRTVLLQVLAGLGAAHQHGIVHRDIKPSNIFFTAAGAAKLGDFGVAHLQDTAQTQTGGFIGTLAYMSPEQIKGEQITFATDIYAIGVTLFVTLTGKLPFVPPGLVEQHLNEPPPKPSSLVSGLPAACDEVVLRCMAKDPGARYASLSALVRAIQSFPEIATDAGAAPQVEQRPHARRRAADARYGVESVTYEHPALQILKARDNELGRAVVLLRLTPGPTRAPLARLLEAAARGDEHLQRVLALDLENGHAVLDDWGGAGSSTTGRLLPLTEPLEAFELCAQIGHALAPLHEAGLCHGRLDAEAVARSGDGFVVGLLPALAVWAEAGEEPPGSASGDTAAALSLCALEAPVAVADGPALAHWAEYEQRAHVAAQRTSRRGADLDRALATAPPGVRGDGPAGGRSR